MTTTEDAILDSASRCFARYGFKRTSMDTIARTAHVAKGTVYLYCDDKADLFHRTVERELRSVDRRPRLADRRPTRRPRS